ncbi:MAG: TonB-dependent receptor [Desulfobacterales bacterium]|nr:TonB-dependent receptor [Desulfobacterales bacterium]
MKKIEKGLKKLKLKIALSFAVSLIFSQGVYAENTLQELESITVTAQKTEENLQDVPISMTVFDEVTLDDRNINEINDMAKYTPGLDIIGYSTIKYAPTMRGIYADCNTFNASVGLYVDGVPVTDGSGYDQTLMDIERVEVLRGPQGTLYGKNTEVGVINVITKKPDNETRGKIGVKLGSDNLREYTTSVSGPLVKDKFYIGVAAKHYEKDGFIQNTYKNETSNDQEHNYGKIHLRWTPTDDLEASLISSKIKYDNAATKINSSENENREVTSDLDAYNEPEVLLNALNINYTVSDSLSLSSTTAHRKYDEIRNNDWDFSNSDEKRFHAITDGTYETLSEELKLNYENDKIKLVSGFFAETQDIHIVKINDKWWKSSIEKLISDRKTDSIGVFSHLTYKLSNKLSVLGGVRYDNVEQEYEDSTETIENSENEVSPKIGLTYDLSENMMTYATISKGYRSGGFNTGVPDGYSKTYDKETLYSYEVGLKGSVLNNRLTYDIAVYHMDINDMQVILNAPTAGGIMQIYGNAGEATSQGVEGSLNFQATNSLNLFAGFSYTHITFDEYHNGTEDLSGNRKEYAPKYNFTIGALYRAGNGFYASADVSGYGDMYLDTANERKRDAYELVNVKCGYETEDYDIYLYAKNIFDKEYDLLGTQGGSYDIYSYPREIGVQFTYRFL